MKRWDVIVLGGGVIGMSLARELRKHGAEVMVMDRTQPGREASHAAAGILSPYVSHLAPALGSLANSSLQAFPEFAHELEDESGLNVDLRNQGAIVRAEELGDAPGTCELSESDLRSLSPALEYQPGFFFVAELSVDPRALMAALLAAAKHRDIHLASGTPVIAVTRKDRELSVTSERTEYTAPVVVNCCGAWCTEIGNEAGQSFPVRPVKGQLLSLAAPRRNLLAHMVRTSEVYLVPRSDGRILVGATVEEAGFDKRVQPDVIQKYHQLAANLIPDLGEARMLEAWAGLRPGTPDQLPILGATAVPGYFVATGHFRNGILLAPITAEIMASLIRGEKSAHDVAPFALERFAQTPPDAIPGSQRRVAS